jgi:hypothetical protein
LLVDGVSLKPGLHEDANLEVGGPVQKGNRIYNSGFEAGPEGWTPVNGFILDDQVMHSGRFSARLEASASRGTAGGIECRPFPVRTGRRYTLSAWVKAAEPDTKVQFRLFEWADRGGDFPENRHERETTIIATTQWARYQLSGIVLPNLHEGYVARIVPSSRIWLDDVQVEEGSQTDYQPAQPLEVGAETSTRWCRVGDGVEVTAWAAAGPQPDRVALKYTLEDLWSRPLTNQVHQVKPGEPDRAHLLLSQPGMYRVRVRADESPATGEVWFGVFPKRDRRLRPDSPFGTHVTSMVPEPYWTGFFTGTLEEYAELLKVACRAIKRADPDAVVVGGCFTPADEAWTRRVLAAGGLEFMDVLSYHVYWSPPMTEATTSGTAPLAALQVQRFVELMREHGHPKPIYMSEGGMRCPPFASWLPADGFERSAPFGPDMGAGVGLTGLDAAAGLVRGMVEMFSAGVERVFYYYSGHGSGAMPWFSTMANGYYVLLDYDGRPKPTMMAYSALEAMLAAAKPAEVTRRDNLTVHLFRREHGTVAVVWSARARQLSVPPAVTVFDLVGNEMRRPTLNVNEPVYVVAPGLKPAQLQPLLL